MPRYETSLLKAWQSATSCEEPVVTEQIARVLPCKVQVLPPIAQAPEVQVDNQADNTPVEAPDLGAPVQAEQR